MENLKQYKQRTKNLKHIFNMITIMLCIITIMPFIFLVFELIIEGKNSILSSLFLSK